MRWAGHVVWMGEKRNGCRLLVGKRPLWKPRWRWVNNVKMDPGEIGWGDVDWIGLAQGRDKWRALVKLLMNLRVPLNAGKLSSGFMTGGLSSSAQFHSQVHSKELSHVNMLCERKLCCTSWTSKKPSVSVYCVHSVSINDISVRFCEA
jgi:hypothetical protein